MKKVLIIDDDQDVVSATGEMVRAEFQVACVGSGREGIQAALQDRPNLILLDVNLPDMHGFDVCQRLREHPATRSIPILILTSLSETESKVRGLELGADDYMTKPFQAKELLARMNARVRRQATEKNENRVLVHANMSVDPRAKEIKIDGKALHLTQIEFELVRYFLLHPNEVIPRRRLLGDLWPNAVVNDRTIDTHIANLRRKIKGAQFPLSTIYGAGYILRTNRVGEGEITQPGDRQ